MTEPTEPTNPLASAMSAAAAPAPDNAAGPDFLASTLALLDDPAGVEPGADPGAGTPTEEPGAGAGDGAGDVDPLAGIDDAFPDLDDKASPQAKERWGELKSELKQERAALRTLKQELETLKSKSLYDPEEVATLKKQVDEYNKELAIHRIEATQEYKTVIQEPLATIGEAAASIARRYEIEHTDLFDALAETDEAKQQRLLTNLVDGMNDRDRLKIYQMADDTALLLRKSETMKARSQEALQELEIRQRETQERTQAERKREFGSHIDRVFGALEDKMPFHQLDPNETKSGVLEQLRQDALAADVASAGADVQAYSAAAGVILPRLIKQNRAIAAENRALKERLSGLSSASPARTRTVPAGAPGTTDQPQDFLSAVFAGIS